MLPFFFQNLLLQPQIAQAVSNSITEISSFSGTISDTELCKAISGGNASLADTTLKQAYNRLYSIQKVMCGSNDPIALRCLYLYLYTLDNFIQPCFNGTKTFTFEVPMFVYKIDALSMYRDANVPSDTTFHINNVGSDIHYINGIYDSSIAYWGNTDIGDMFRVSFYITDVGVSGYSNGGVNEIGGNVATSTAAFTAWKANLATMVTEQLQANGIELLSVSCTTKDIVETASTYTKTAYLTITVDDSQPNLTALMLNANSTNEISAVNGAPVTGWKFGDILLTDTTTHRRVATIVSQTAPEVTESYITEAQLIAILTNVEQISKSCCS